MVITNEFDIETGKVDCKLKQGDNIIEHETNLTTDRALELNDLWRKDYDIDENGSKTYVSHIVP